MEPVAVSVREAGAALSLGRTKIYELIKEGHLTAFKVGRRTLVKFESVRALADGCMEVSK